MSTPPPNIDSRPLPRGWLAQYNWEYKAWFYVNEMEHPPRSSWEHPLGPPQYTPPPGPPPPNRDFNRSPYQDGYNQAPAPRLPTCRRQRLPCQAAFSASTTCLCATAGSSEEERTRSGHCSAGGAGLVGGAILMDAFENHEDNVRDEAYDQGYDNGYGNGYDDGGDCGGF
ncbi:hypothetical protein BDR05DRAFT_144831 [Suillus weaverae]|nr:hypothetical protein BDR05DRAFT_144831 [Suillus weaverae]